jgi:hypothetical protein
MDGRREMTTCFNSDFVFSPAPYQAPVAVMDAMAAVHTILLIFCCCADADISFFLIAGLLSSHCTSLVVQLLSSWSCWWKLKGRGGIVASLCKKPANLRFADPTAPNRPALQGQNSLHAASEARRLFSASSLLFLFTSSCSLLLLLCPYFHSFISVFASVLESEANDDAESVREGDSLLLRSAVERQVMKDVSFICRGAILTFSPSHYCFEREDR